MLQHQKQKGFIITKSRVINRSNSSFDGDLQSQRMNKFRITQRTPGKIVNIKLNQNHQLYNKSLYFPIKNTKDKNQNNIKYQYQEINQVIENIEEKDSKRQFNVGDQNPEKPENKIKQKFDFTAYMNLYQILKKINDGIHQRKTQFDTLSPVKQYAQFLKTSSIDNIEQFKIASLHKKTIRDAMLYQRLSMVLITFVQMKDSYEISKKLINNLLSYSIENYFLIGIALTNSNSSQMVDFIKNNGKQHLLTKGINTLKNNTEIIFNTLNKIAQFDNYFYLNFRRILHQSKTFTPDAALNNFLQFYAYYLCATHKIIRLPFFSVAPSPYLQSIQFDRYTLVIDFSQVFCLKGKKYGNFFRPYCQYFIEQMNKYYEIVAFSNMMPEELDPLIKLIDEKGLIKHRLYKYHFMMGNRGIFKDMNRLGRNLNRVVVLDSFNDDSPNSISVPNWKGKKNDAELAQLCPLLAMIALKKVKVPEALAKYREIQQQNLKYGLKYSNYAINLQ